MTLSTVGRILERAKELSLTPRAVSLKAGLNPTFVRDLLRRPNASPSLQNARKLASALDTTVEWLTGSPDAEASSAVDVAASAAPSFVKAEYGGVVEAGTFRPVADVEDDPDRPPLFYPRDPHFPQAQLFVFDVAGDSMNALQPRPILPGDKLLCVAIERVRLPLRDRMVVVVEQVINGGLLRERSVKQVEEHDDRFEFCPRSRNSKHKPIVVPKDFTADEGRTVAVIAVVRSIVNEVPLG